MTREELVRMAQYCDLGRVCGPLDTLLDHEWEDLHRFAHLVAAAEREACAKIAEEHQHDCYYGGADWFEAKRIKAAIQERNKQ